jgi:hypothetical protein
MNSSCRIQGPKYYSALLNHRFLADLPNSDEMVSEILDLPEV